MEPPNPARWRGTNASSQAASRCVLSCRYVNQASQGAVCCTVISATLALPHCSCASAVPQSMCDDTSTVFAASPTSPLVSLLSAFLRAPTEPPSPLDCPLGICSPLSTTSTRPCPCRAAKGKSSSTLPPPNLQAYPVAAFISRGDLLPTSLFLSCPDLTCPVAVGNSSHFNLILYPAICRQHQLGASPTIVAPSLEVSFYVSLISSLSSILFVFIACLCCPQMLQGLAILVPRLQLGVEWFSRRDRKNHFPIASIA
jgi:hypothetical protein